ncbi:MAG: ABC transporter ATP-binding protein, partial [Tatlockia sp.]|nr:ABC transporter ATP-binding protein [Tatlockia sp.]
MATFKDIVNYYKPYHAIAIFSITAASIFEIVDLVVPYAIGQILNVLSRQSLDKPVQNAIAFLAQLIQLPQNQLLSIGFLLGIIFIVTVVKAPIQVWTTWWFHWDIALR